MTRLVLQMGISIDGFVALPDGSQPWLGQREDDAAKQWKLETVRGTDAHLMGRVTYQDMAAHWPGSDSDYAAPMNRHSEGRLLEDPPDGWVAGVAHRGRRPGRRNRAHQGPARRLRHRLRRCRIRPLPHPPQLGRRVPAQHPALRTWRRNADLHRDA
jgi:RibD C-terminal domain